MHGGFTPGVDVEPREQRAPESTTFYSKKVRDTEVAGGEARRLGNNRQPKAMAYFASCGYFVHHRFAVIQFSVGTCECSPP